MEIRVYDILDKDQVLDLIRLNTPAFFDPSEEKVLEDYLEQGLEDYFVLLEDDEIIGAGGLNYTRETGFATISWDIIHPDYQGIGIGKKLVEHRINWVKSKTDFNKIEVRTSQHTDKFYEKMGFKLKEIKKDYWAPGYDLYYMITTI